MEMKLKRYLKHDKKDIGTILDIGVLSQRKPMLKIFSKNDLRYF
jgi:hypothetical protein